MDKVPTYTVYRDGKPVQQEGYRDADLDDLYWTNKFNDLHGAGRIVGGMIHVARHSTETTPEFNARMNHIAQKNPGIIVHNAGER